jgi:hypothetical protein
LSARLLDIESRAASIVLRVSFFVMVAIIIGNASEGSFLLAALQFVVEDRETLATYQDFALLLLISIALCAVGQRSMASRVWTYMAGLVALFLTGARSEFLAFFLVAFLLEWSLSRHRWVVLVSVGAAVTVVIAVVQTLVYLLPENRVIDLVANRAEGSLSERRVMLEAAVRTLGENPLLGHFASYAPGEYAHNLLSVWVDFGFVGMTLLLMLLVWALLDLAGRQRTQGRQASYAASLCLLMGAAVLLIGAKSFTYPMLPFALGLCAGLQEGRRSWWRIARLRAAVPGGVTTADASR